MENGARDQAILVYQRILQAVPRHKRARAELANLLQQTDTASPPASPSSPDTDAMRKLSTLIETKDYRAASQQAETLIEAHPTSAAVWNGYGAALQGVGDLEAATKAFQKAVELAPEDSRIKFNLARHYRKMGNLDNTIQLLKEILVLQPDWTKVHVMLGSAYKRKGQVKDALSYFKRAAELDPTDSKIQNNLGVIFRHNHQTESALPHFKEAIQINPKYAEAYYNLGNSFKDLENIDDAITNYKIAIDLKPKEAEFWFNLATAYFDKNRYEECLNCLAKVEALNSNHPKVKKAKGRAFLEYGDIDGALKLFEKLIDEDPNNADFHYYLGRIYNYQGNISKSIESLSKSFQLNSNSLAAYIGLSTKPQGTLSEDIIRKLKEASDLVTNALTKEKSAFVKAHVLNHAGDINGAWAYYRKANSTAFSDIKKFAKGTIVEQHHALTQLKKRPPPEIKDDEAMPISLFILAPSRSGKTRMEYLLGTSPHIKRSYENRRFPALIEQSAEYSGLPPTGRLEALTPPAKEKFALLYKEWIQEWISDRSIVTDTSPHRIFNAWDIANVIPNSYFIFIERNPIDVAVGIFQKHYKSDGNFYAYHPDTIRDHLLWYQNMREVLLEQLRDRAIKIKYADLLSNPEAQLQEVESLLGVALNCHVPEDFQQGPPNTSGPYRELLTAIPKEKSLDFLSDDLS